MKMKKGIGHGPLIFEQLIQFRAGKKYIVVEIFRGRKNIIMIYLGPLLLTNK